VRPRLPVLTALLAGIALAVTACSDDGGGGQEPESTGAGEELPAVEGGYGDEPTITFPESGAPAELQSEVLQEGDGTEVGADDFVVADYHGQVWGEEQAFDSSFARDAPSGFSLNGVIQGWKQGLAGTHVGDRVLLSIPPELGYGAEGQPQGGIPGDASLVFVVDVVEVYPPDAGAQADAEPVTPEPELPVTVEGDLGEPASITVDDGAPEPTEAGATVIATGDGDPLRAGETALVQVAETAWDNSNQQSTWDAGGVTSLTIDEELPTGLLADVPVGSRVVLQLPGQPAGEQSAELPPTALVIDVVDAIRAR